MKSLLRIAHAVLLCAVLAGAACSTMQDKLERMAGPNGAHIERLESYAQSPNPDVRRDVVRIVRAFTNNPTAQKMLLRASYDEDPWVQIMAAETMMFSPQPELATRAVEMLRDSPPRVRSQMAGALLKRAFVSRWRIYKVQTPDGETRISSPVTLLTSDTQRLQEIMKYLEKLASDSNPQVRAYALPALAQVAESNDFDKVIGAFKEDPSPEVRAQIARAFDGLLWSYAVQHEFAKRGILVVGDATLEQMIKLISCEWILVGRCGASVALMSDSKAQVIVSALIESVEHDKGEWEVTYVDRFPFLPIRHYHKLKCTVAFRAVDALFSVPSDNHTLNAALKRWLQSPDRELRGIALFIQEQRNNNSITKYVDEWIQNQVSPPTPNRN